MTEPFESHNPLPVADRQKIIELLNERMANILDLHYQTLLAHWNVRGRNFIALHRFFDEFAGSNGADNWCDWVAERIGQLGGVVRTTIPYIAAHTALPEYPTDVVRADDHVRHLAGLVSMIIVQFRDAARTAQAAQDSVTADILLQVQRSAEKYLWLIEAHFEPTTVA
jgi:starvation-inducible DNA-binding protein